jgi:hypothetical protein
VHWDNWLGTAPVRPYGEKYYHPHNWRGWWDFGCGALGDMGCHTANLPFMALELTHPSSISAESEELNPETFPAWARVTYQFPARGQQPPVKMTWYEGHKDGNLVQPPQELVETVLAEYTKILIAGGDKQPKDDKPGKPGKQASDSKMVKDGKKIGLRKGGCIMVGTKGILYSPHDYGSVWYLLPADAHNDFKAPDPIFHRHDLKSDDEANKVEWLAAVKGGPKPLSNFDYSGLLAETILLGNVAIRAGTALDWDGPSLKFPNAPKAEALLRRQYREPWGMM